MKHFLTISLCFLALSLSAQETITYPYNPDGDADGLVAVPDLQDILAVYGNPFSPAEIMVGDTALSEWIQILYQALQDQQAVIEAMQGAGACDYAFPDGLVGQTIAWDLSNSNDYIVPAGKNLFIINVWATIGYYFNIDGKVVLGHDSWGKDGNGNVHSAQLKLPLCVKSGEVVSYTSSNVTVSPSFYGILTDAVVDPISFEFGNVGSGNESYTVPVGKTLVITNVWNYSQNSVLTIDGGNVLTGLWNESLATYAEAQQLEIPLFINSGLVIGMPDNTASFNGYLVDEDYFADCGGGGSSEGGGVRVSLYGDTLFIPGSEYLIIPGLSENNLHHNLPDYGSVSDGNGNTYRTMIYDNKEWLADNLKSQIDDYINVINISNFNELSYPDSIGYYYAVNGIENVCPTGWHLPSVQEWLDLVNYLFEKNLSFSNSFSEYDDDYKRLWSTHEQEGTNQTFYNLFNSSYIHSGNGLYVEPASLTRTIFKTNEGCPNSSNNNKLYVEFGSLNNSNGWGFGVYCGNTSGMYTQVRCVKD